MKLTNKKKGFTIVELVIVIAVIAILAAVLIPNLSRLVTKANESTALQNAENALKEDLITAKGDYSKIGIDTAETWKGTYADSKYTYSADAKYNCVFDTASGTWAVTPKSGS